MTEVILFTGVLLAQTADFREAADLLIFLCIACNALFLLFTSSGIPCVIMILTLCADTLLVLLNVQITTGIWLFGTVQILYAWCLKKRGYCMLPARILVFILPLAATFMTGMHLMMEGSLIIPSLLSFSQLLMNMMCALRMEHRSRNTCDLIFAVGMVLFLGCDLCVGLRNLPVPDMVQQTAYALNWIFYIPSQILLTISLPDVYGHVKM